jgi:PleD family two-component response regulator
VAPHVTVTAGVATATCRPGVAPQRLITAADRQLYAAKAAGRNTVAGRFYDAIALAEL